MSVPTPPDDELSGLDQRLMAFLAPHLPGATDLDIDGLRRVGGGNSLETWAFDLRSVGDDRRTQLSELILRCDPDGALAYSSRLVEFHLLQALNRTATPVPAARYFDDGTIFRGRQTMVVDRWRGTADRSTLTDRDPLRLGSDGRYALARELCDTLAALHSQDVRESGFDAVLPVPTDNPARLELQEWERRLVAAQLEPYPALDLARRWLRSHLPPPPPRLVLVHGDFRPANVLVSDGRLNGVIDWEFSRVGDFHDDLGWYLTPHYRHEHFISDVWQEHDFLSRYADQTGFAVDLDAVAFWRGMASFRLAVMALAGIRNFCEQRTDRPWPPSTGLVRRFSVDIVDGSQLFWAPPSGARKAATA